jgi:signal transduction histidine kinase
MIHEAVINALKHAHPSRVSVDVQADDTRQVKILVVNDGHGFRSPAGWRRRVDALDAGPQSLRSGCGAGRQDGR